MRYIIRHRTAVTVTVTEALVLRPPARRQKAHHRVNGSDNLPSYSVDHHCSAYRRSEILEHAVTNYRGPRVAATDPLDQVEGIVRVLSLCFGCMAVGIGSAAEYLK